MAVTLWDTVLDHHTGIYNPGPFTYQDIRTAAAVICAKEARNQTALLTAILSRLDNLGVDGIHTIIRHQAAQIRKADRARRKKQATMRRSLRAAKKGHP